MITSRVSSSQKRGPSPAATGVTTDAGVDIGAARGAEASGLVALCLCAAGLALWRRCAVVESVRGGVAVAVVVGEGVVEAGAEVVGVAAWTAEPLEVVCVLGEEVPLCVPDEEVVVCFRVGDWAGGRLSVYTSAMGTLEEVVVVEVGVVGVVVVPVVVVVDVVMAEVVDVEAVVGVSALAAAAGTANPIVATRTTTRESRWRDRLQIDIKWFISLGNLAAFAGP